ncbi:MAG: hypothetical protein HY923_03485 [Elusimicrobia bacterium]|nr:hypothetical protein [Elusimicrobiota bacterium]
MSSRVFALMLLFPASAFAVLPRVPAASFAPFSSALPIAPPSGLPAPGSTLSSSLAPPALIASLIPAPAAPEYRGSREIARDEAAEKLEAAGMPAMLAGQGLTMWQILRHRGRSGEQVHLTFGLPPDGRPFERGGGDPARREELKRRLESSEARITALVAETLGVDPASVVLHERLVEGCCGAGCESCLLGAGKSKHAKKWTGLKKGPESR